MKIATQVVLFGQDKWIMRNIENSYPHVDKIYIAYSKLPWGYNPQARQTYVNSFDLNIIKQSRFIDKITIIEGDWLTEEAQRNACVNQAKKDGIDYLMVHDADEFYFHDDFEKIKQIIEKNPNYDSYSLKLYCFWKSFKYILISPSMGKVGGIAQSIINLNNGVIYLNKRGSSAKSNMVIGDVVFYHGSYVLTNEELLNKVKTWGHRNDFNVDVWYNNVWLPWTLNSKNLHPVNPPAWSHAEVFTDKLPEVLENFE